MDSFSQTQRTGLSHKSKFGVFAFLGLAAYMLAPAFNSVQVEGFTAQIEINAIAANARLLDQANITFPLHIEYFYLTRLGVVYLLQILISLSGNNGDIVFRIATALSFLLFAACTLVVARRYGRVHPGFAGLAFLLTAGLAEIGFYFNDNVVSAAFGMLGLALLPTAALAADRLSSRQMARGVLSGLALGVAIICRTDAAFFLPFAAGFAWLTFQRFAQLCILGFLVGAGVLAVVTASTMISGTTLVQAVQIAQLFDGFHSGFRSPAILAGNLVLFLGLPMLGLLPLLAVQGWPGATLKQILVLAVLPLAFLPYMVLHSLEVRQFYPLLAPFICIHGGRCLEQVVRDLQGRWSPRFYLSAAWVAVTVGLWVAPPVFVAVKEGPRAVIGRLWSPLLWFKWQNAMAAGLDDIAGLVDLADTRERITVLTTESNAEHYLRLRLWQRGYRALPPADAMPGCTGGFEAWRLGPHELDLMRTENPHLILKQRLDYVAALQIQQALACPAIAQSPEIYVSDQGWHTAEDRLMIYLTTVQPGLAVTPIVFGWPPSAASLIDQKAWRVRKYLPDTMMPNHTARLTPDQLSGLAKAANGIVQAQRASHDGPTPTYDEFMQMFKRRFWK